MLVAWLMAFAVVAVVLAALAHWQVSQELDRHARQRIAASTQGLPIARWPLTNAHDIIAGRVFGDAETRFDDAGLHITSAGEAVEIGLPLDGPLDLARYGLASIGVNASAQTHFQWSVYFPSSNAPCRSDFLTIADSRIASRLDQLDWRCSLPTRPAVDSLRLVVDAPRGENVTLYDFALKPVMALQRPEADSIPIVSSRADLPIAKERLNAMHESIQPIVVVAGGWRDAATMQLRSDLRLAVPAVIAVSDATIASAAEGKSLATFKFTWLLLALLLFVWARPPKSPRLRIVVQVGAALLMPLWLSIGLRMGTTLSVVDTVFVAAGVLYIATLLLQRGQSWQWIGKPSAWLIPAASVLLTIALALALSRDGGPTLPDSISAFRYFAWAALQQLIVLRIVADRISGLSWSPAWVSLAAATAFALLHAPNQSLMLLTLIGGLFWTWNWQHHRALLPNVVAHALCGLIASAAIDRSWLWSAEIGSRFFAG